MEQWEALSLILLFGLSATIRTNSPELSEEILDAGIANSSCLERLIEVSALFMSIPYPLISFRSPRKVALRYRRLPGIESPTIFCTLAVIGSYTSVFVALVMFFSWSKFWYAPYTDPGRHYRISWGPGCCDRLISMLKN
ncbi:Uncharacterised protein [Sphingobacterium daejeonense]|nr:Uncharacterised protein [Sphingobacterium daejeonense]